METKTSLSFIELHPAIRYALDVVSYVAGRDYRPVITSAQDSTHAARSLHYGRVGDVRCRAIDVRMPLPRYIERLVKELGRRLGPDFDIVPETDHLHIEYDPKD